MLTGAVDAVQVGDESAEAMLSPLSLAARLIAEGIDPLPRLTCRDHNRIALQSDLLGLRALGVSSVLLDRGEPDSPRGKPAGKPVFDVDRRELVAMANALNEEDWAEGEHEFIIGTGVPVAGGESEPDTEALLSLAAAGARFLQLQPCFDAGLLKEFMQRLVDDRVTWSYSVIATLAPLSSPQEADLLLQGRPGVQIPGDVVRRLEDSRDPEQEGIGICAGLIREAVSIPGISGVHLLTTGNPEAVTACITESGIRS